MITFTIDEAALGECLRDTAWLHMVPTTSTDWKLHWHKRTRTIIDKLCDHGGVLTADGLPNDRSVAFVYDLLKGPKGLQVWAQTDTEDDMWGTRLATIYYHEYSCFTCDVDTPAEAVTAFVHELVDALNDQFREVQTVVGLPPEPAADSAPPLELIVHRDPDGDTDISLFVNGQPNHQAVEYHVDPGRGTIDDATEQRADRYQHFRDASPAARERLIELYAIYPITEANL